MIILLGKILGMLFLFLCIMLIVGKLGYWKDKKNRGKDILKAFELLFCAYIAVFMMILIGAGSYSSILRTAEPHRFLTAQNSESEFFAVQTITTVGYGSGISGFDASKVSKNIVLKVQKMSSCLMFSSVVVWGLFISAIVNLINVVFGTNMGSSRNN